MSHFAKKSLPSSLSFNLLPAPEIIRLMALRDGVNISSKEIIIPTLGNIIPRFEIDLNTTPTKRITVRVNSHSPVTFTGSHLIAQTDFESTISTPATLAEKQPEGIYKFGMMRENAPRSWVYDYHTYCCYTCSFCFKESEWEARKIIGSTPTSYKDNYASCIDHARKNASLMTEKYDIVWLCTGSIPNSTLELERHCLLAETLRENGYLGDIYLSQVISSSMIQSDNDCMEQMTKLKNSGITRFNTGVEIISKELRSKYIEGHKGDLTYSDYLNVFKIAVSVFGRGYVGTCLLAGLESSDLVLRCLAELMQYGVNPAPTVFTPFTKSQLNIPFRLSIDELVSLSADFKSLQQINMLPQFSGVFSLT